jgi:transmembrane sensor
MEEHNVEISDRAKAEKEAIAWFTRLNGKPSREDKQNFRAWQRLNIGNEDAYRSISALWSSSVAPGTEIAREEASSLSGHLSRIRELRKRKKTGSKAGAGTLAMIFLLGSGWIWLEKPNFWQDMSADYVSARGETRQILLDDGSSVLLDADTAIDVRLNDDFRQVKLLRGTAFFEVKPSSVPFIVEAANGSSRVLGTAFDVALDNEGVEVTLEHGSLRVELGNSSDQVVLKPGEAVAYSNDGLSTPHDIELDYALAWHDGRFVFNNASLQDVLQRIERYRDGRIIIVGSALGARRISGSFSLNDTNAALSSLQSSVGFKMNKLSERLVVIRP